MPEAHHLCLCNELCSAYYVRRKKQKEPRFSAALPEGIYTLRVVAEGFNEYTEDVKISPEQTTRVEAVLTTSSTVDPTPIPVNHIFSK